MKVAVVSTAWYMSLIQERAHIALQTKWQNLDADIHEQ